MCGLPEQRTTGIVACWWRNKWEKRKEDEDERAERLRTEGDEARKGGGRVMSPLMA